MLPHVERACACACARVCIARVGWDRESRDWLRILSISGLHMHLVHEHGGTCDGCWVRRAHLLADSRRAGGVSKLLVMVEC